jgi:hypothetical protein
MRKGVISGNSMKKYIRLLLVALVAISVQKVSAHSVFAVETNGYTGCVWIGISTGCLLRALRTCKAGGYVPGFAGAHSHGKSLDELSSLALSARRRSAVPHFQRSAARYAVSEYDLLAAWLSPQPQAR